MRPKTISEKIFESKAGRECRAGDVVECEVDYVMVNDVTGPLAFRAFEETGMEPVREKIVLIPDHFVPAKDVDSAQQAKEMREFAKRHGIPHYYEVGRSGVCHQVMIDDGFVAPGRLIVGADSHTCTYGGLNAFGTGIGSTEAAYVFATGRLWFRVPESIEIVLRGKLRENVSGKDLILRIVGDLGMDGATYKALEFSGPGVASIPMPDRFSMSNMAIEAGGKAGLFPYDPVAKRFAEAVSRGEYEGVNADPGAEYVRTLEYDLSKIVPMVAVPPRPDGALEASKCDVAIDQAYLGSCTNGRIEDMRIAAGIVKGKRVAPGVRMIVVPASVDVHRKMAAEGLIEVFLDAGAFVSGPTCGACLGGHMGILSDGEVAVSSTNRNFIGRMGHPGSKVYLASPATVATSALAGRIRAPEGFE
ncbi:MAG: 3-isopropylmalate dehydratase large subunit [Thermoplasmatales archaeon]|nr:3-isopropylmalate dehydratase large subunit [Thermoplasmatales archaeon]